MNVFFEIKAYGGLNNVSGAKGILEGETLSMCEGNSLTVLRKLHVTHVN